MAAFGGLARLDDDVVDGPTVMARDLDGGEHHIARAAVWRDGTGRAPSHPHPTGLATGPSEAAAAVAALSDRLGAEASAAFHDPAELRPAPRVDGVGDQAVVFDGRIGHDVPTVVVVGDSFVRWGAGSSWLLAYRRAFAEAASGDPAASAAELAELRARLGLCGLEPLLVDLGSETLRQAGLHRISMQLARRPPPAHATT